MSCQGPPPWTRSSAGPALLCLWPALRWRAPTRTGPCRPRALLSHLCAHAASAHGYPMCRSSRHQHPFVRQGCSREHPHPQQLLGPDGASALSLQATRQQCKLQLHHGLVAAVPVEGSLQLDFRSAAVAAHQLPIAARSLTTTHSSSSSSTTSPLHPNAAHAGVLPTAAGALWSYEHPRTPPCRIRLSLQGSHSHHTC